MDGVMWDRGVDMGWRGWCVMERGWCGMEGMVGWKGWHGMEEVV